MGDAAGRRAPHGSLPTHLLSTTATSTSSSSSTSSTSSVMSWQAYADDQLLATKQVKEAVILGHDGNVWATSQDFPVTPEELKVIAANYSKVDTLAQSGLTVAGVRYMYISSNDKVVRAKKGTGGLHLVKTVQAIIIPQLSTAQSRLGG